MNELERIPTADMPREAWLLERRKALGGSDIGAILGLNQYRSPLAVWADKLGLLPEQADSEAMRLGRDLEDYVARRFCEHAGLKVQRYNYLLRDNARHIAANIDRRVVGQSAGLECKTASALSEGSYKGGVFPGSYYAQCVCYLAVTGWERWYLCALVMGRGVYTYQMTTLEEDTCPGWCESSVYVSPDELDALRTTAKAWWETHILQGEMPAPDGSPSAADTISALFPDALGEDMADLTGCVEQVQDYLNLKKRIKELEGLAEEVKQSLMLAMGDKPKGTCPGYSVSWSSQTRTTFDRKALQKDHPELDLAPYLHTTSGRTFRCAEKKGA